MKLEVIIIILTILFMIPGKTQGLVENFIQNKVASLLDSFIEFEKLMVAATQSLTIHNTKIKPKLLEELSQVFSMPLQHIQGSISTLTLNLPWQKLFLKAETPLRIQIEGLSLRCKLKTDRSELYLLKKREQYIANLTQKLFNPYNTSRSNISFINKALKQYFLNRVILEVKNVCIYIEIDLKTQIDIIIRLKNCTFRKENQKLKEQQKIHLELLDLGLYYKTGAKEAKEVQLVSPANINYQRITSQEQNNRTLINNLNIDKVHVHLNNYNFGNIANILLLINWHNSFIDLPFSAWKCKPHILSQCKPFNKLRYCAALVLQSIKESNLKKQLQIRKKYLNMYSKLLTDITFTEQNKKEMEQLEKSMPIWKIIAYRSFAINLTKIKIEKRQAQQVMKGEVEKRIEKQKQNFNLMANMISGAWIKKWFSNQRDAAELQNQFLNKLASIQQVPHQVQTLFNAKIEVITIGISIISNFGVQPFISLVGFHCEWNKKSLHMVNKWQQSIQFRKCKIQYEHYLGHNQRYKNLLSESKEHLAVFSIQQCGQQQEQDQFEDINYFIEVFFTNQSKVIQLKLLPFDLVINYEVIEKINILLNVDYLSKVPNMKHIEQVYSQRFNPQTILDLQIQRILSNKKKGSKQENPQGLLSKFKDKPKNWIQQSTKEITVQLNREFRVTSAANIIIPVNLRVYPQTEVLIRVFQFHFRSNTQQYEIDLKSILVKGNFSQKINEEQNGPYANYIKGQVEIVTLVNKFNAKITMQKHINFDQNFIEFSPIRVQIPQAEKISRLIELFYLHVPKKKDINIRMFHRRKQSIGQQFMDACQNLNEHINKSIIMSSQRNTNRSIIKEKKAKMTKLKLQGFTIADSSLELVISQIQLKIQQMGFEGKNVQSYNNKNIIFFIKNLNKSIKIIKDINLYVKKESIKHGVSKKLGQAQIKLNNIQILNTDLKVIIMLNKMENKQIGFQFKNIRVEENQQARCRRIEACFKLCYDQDIKGFKNKNSRTIKIPLVEECNITHQTDYKYNLFQRTVNINTLAINIKPSLFTLCSMLLKEFYIDQEAKYTVTNHTINTISIKVPPKNYYIELKHNSKCSLQKSFSQIILFNRKLILQFNSYRANEIPKSKNQYIPISDNNYLINKQVAPNHFIIQSSIRIMNHQDKTLLIKIYENQSILFQQSKQNRQKLDKLSNYQSKPYSVNLEHQISVSQQQWDGLSLPKTYKRPSQPKQRQGKCVTLPLKPKQLTHILIDQDQHKYFQLIDQGNFFTELKLTDLFQSKEKIVQTNENIADQDLQYLVIKSEITKLQQSQVRIFTFHIFSPLLFVNKTPWPLQYRISKEQTSEILQGQEKRIGRRRSFEVHPMKKIKTLCSQKLRSFHYNEIQNMKISIKKYQREFHMFGNLILKIKEKKGSKPGQFIKQNQLMTLRNIKHEIQMVLSLQFSENIMKLVVYPQFVFVNLAKKQLNFSIKQGQVTYHQIRLNAVQIEYNKQLGKNKNRLLTWEQQQNFINEIINMQSQKLKEREVLKQLFEKYEEYVQTFTGSLSSQDRKKIVYKSGKQPVKKEGAFLKSTIGGFVSDFGSDTQISQVKNKKLSSYLSEEEIIRYGTDENLIFKRYVAHFDSFSLLLFIPTVHIINKSQAIFYAKSRCQNLVMIQKENHNFILTNESSIDIQACFDQHEEISLTDWTEINLQELKTIYYAKDMIQYHGSGYQSKEYNFRKKKMKKMPKIFYRVITCKYERGQKIIIQESQYPPISFINNTNDRIKIQERQQRFIQQLVNKGDMAEYAPRNPYTAPEFRLQIAQYYQYKLLAVFKVQKKQTLNLDFGIILCVDYYKGNTIITIQSNSQQLDPNNIQKKYFKQELKQKQELFLEEVTKNSLSLKQMTIAVMNSCNKQLNAILVQDVTFIHQNRNQKDYYKLVTRKIEGYDYMGVQPQFIFHSKKDKKIFNISNQKDKEQQNMVEFEVIIKQHKNALVVEKCLGVLKDNTFCISADLVLAYVKNYYQNIFNFYAFTKYYRSHRQQKKKPEILLKKFIVQYLKWEPTSLTFQTRNLSILETFLNKKYQKLIVKFLNWLGDLKPLCFDMIQFNHEETNLRSILNQIDLRKKMNDFGTLLMDYPLSQAKQLAVLIMGDDNITISHKLNSIYKILKTAEYILSWAVGLNENLKMKTKSYNESFIQNHKENNDIIDKMQKFEYCEWKYAVEFPRTKLQRKIRRLQRYNDRNRIENFDENRAKIKLAIDSFLKNKLFRKIDKIYQLHNDCVMSIVEEWIILYQKKNQWTIIRVEYFLNSELNDRQLSLSYWQGESQVQTSGIFQNKGDRVKTKKVQGINLSDFNGETLKSFKEEIRGSILSYYY